MSLVIFLGYFLFFLYFQTLGIYGGDAGDLVTAAYTGSIAHPPGYPLYSLVGYIVSHIPFSTVAWRIGLLSSIPAALVCTFVWKFVRRITGSIFIAFISASILATNYVFWLYAIVPEVFSLFLLFSILITYIAYLYNENSRIQHIYFIALLFGVGLTHHHMILFILPSVFFILWHKRKVLGQTKLKQRLIIVSAFIFGLIPYVWAPLSALRTAPTVWSNPVNFSNFIRLITRSEYGSFQSGATYGHTIQARFLQMPILYEMFTNDFTMLGALLFLIGLYGLWKKERLLFYYLGSVILLVGPFFFFYASYLYSSRFQIATAERFILPLYLYASIIVGYGMHTVTVEVKRTFKFIEHQSDIQLKNYKKLLIPTIYGLFFIIPFSLFVINYPKISILKYDYTAELLGRDFLQPLEKDSILLLKGDHAVFNTQYIHYVYDVRPDIAPIHLSKLLRGDLQEQIKKYYPHITSPYSENPVIFLKNFIEANNHYPIYSSAPIAITPPEYTWVSMGIVYRLYKKTDVPNPPEVMNRSDRFWSTYQDPLDGSLGKYSNLMQSNVLDYYRNAHMRSGLYALQFAKNNNYAIDQFKAVVKLDPTYSYGYYTLADAYIKSQQCSKASDTLDSLRNIELFTETNDYYQVMYSLQKDCFKNDEAAEKWKSYIDKADESENIPLEEL